MADSDSMHVAVTGATGLVGSAWCAHARAARMRVTRLVRGTPTQPGDVRWNPHGDWDASSLEGLDGVIHLAGASIAAGRWTKERKRAILESRVVGTRNLCAGLARLSRPPRAFVSASGVGYYGNSHVRGLDERSPQGSGFLAEVAVQWEVAAQLAESFGARVVRLRIGAVLSRRGGVLAAMRVPFLLGLGGPVGSGAQGFNWIHIDDLVAVIDWAVRHESLSGPVNAVAPHLISQREFAQALGAALRRPSFVPLPAWFVRLAFGEMGTELLLSGQWAAPAALVRDGFAFASSSVERALSAEYGGSHAR